MYEMVGSEADQSKAEELFNRLDLNSDGSISQVRGNLLLFLLWVGYLAFGFLAAKKQL